MDSEACFGLWKNDGHEGIDSQSSRESLPPNVSAYCQCVDATLPTGSIWGRSLNLPLRLLSTSRKYLVTRAVHYIDPWNFSS
jgi:hypothetical protein